VSGQGRRPDESVAPQRATALGGARPAAKPGGPAKVLASRSGAARGATPRPGSRGGTRTGSSRPSAPRTGSSRPAAAARARTVAPEHRTSNAWVRGAILLSILVMLAVTLLPTARSLIRQRAEIGALQDKVVEQSQNVGDLQKEQERWKDPAYVEQQARERLKFVKVGDRSYSVIDGTKQAPKAPSGAVVAAPSANSDSPWYGQLWQSVQLADQPAAGMAPVPGR
jgi:cell division protein FtsB